jgi:hypothetical protein
MQPVHVMKALQIMAALIKYTLFPGKNKFHAISHTTIAYKATII